MPIPHGVKAAIEKKEPTTTHIDLSNCGLDDNDMVDLQELLEQNRYITSVDLSDNNITDTGCQLLIPLRITKLNLSNNHACDEGVEHLLKNPSIRELDISKNGLTDVGANLLFQQIDKYKSLSISGNPKITYTWISKIYSHFGIKVSDGAPVGIDLGRNISSLYSSEDLDKSPFAVETKPQASSARSPDEALADKLFSAYKSEPSNLTPSQLEHAIKLFCQCLGIDVDIRQKPSSTQNV